ncbi:MAG TPA: potassium-transporting ATPase subunit KdpC [Rhodoglobus sp.]|nr:potassium-transporting ATPase subunit KdpC [Rhodoglobus sp.]HPU04792.1 potassium-transporting ATPase subunit KdpC [Rhodoglobus sp.]HQA22143.1 potassium-transporting ATPase subunit KdpC [Rhodoglobus sp.]HQE47349.1 potassium-transporting ATPase subunit KdpC [Rhodoglobus sp.]
MRMKQTWTALRALLIFTVVLGVGYPLLITGVGQLALPSQANGSLVRSDGAVVGSALIGQSFTDADGTALPEWFQSRPSAAGAGYDGGASSGSNYGPENPDLISAIQDRKSAIESLDSVTASEIPADALTASGSGLDPHISPAYALLQVPRVAEARGIPEAQVRALVEAFIQGRDLGYLGEPTVNVLQLNIALAKLG